MALLERVTIECNKAEAMMIVTALRTFREIADRYVLHGGDYGADHTKTSPEFWTMQRDAADALIERLREKIR